MIFFDTAFLFVALAVLDGLKPGGPSPLASQTGIKVCTGLHHPAHLFLLYVMCMCQRTDVHMSASACGGQKGEPDVWSWEAGVASYPMRAQGTELWSSAKAPNPFPDPLNPRPFNCGSVVTLPHWKIIFITTLNYMLWDLWSWFRWNSEKWRRWNTRPLPASNDFYSIKMKTRWV